jgi:hypothetical protein
MANGERVINMLDPKAEEVNGNVCPSQQSFAVGGPHRVIAKIRPVIKNNGVAQRKRYGGLTLYL